MWSRRIMVGCGAVFLVGLMLVLCFSLGVYVGERGTSRTQSQSKGTPVIGVGGTPNVIGTLQRYGDNTLTLATAQGPRTIALTPQTQVRRGNEAATFADLLPGVALAVWGEPGDGGRVLVARVIMILTTAK